MDRSRQRFNAKARQSAVGSHKKKGKRSKQPGAVQSDQQANPNAEIIVSKTDEQREVERREKLRTELLAQLDSKANSKKKKRLDKYIEKKLKQEERVALFEKLSKSQAHADTALHLQSSSTLGTGKPSTHKTLLDEQEDRDVRRAIGSNAVAHKRQRGIALPLPMFSKSADENGNFPMSVHGGEGSRVGEGTSRLNPVVIVDSGFSTSTVPAEDHAQKETLMSSAVGSALQRNPDGSVVAPIIGKRKRKGNKAFTLSWKAQRTALRMPAYDGAESESSFDSSDSANDTEDEEVDSDAESSGLNSEQSANGSGAPGETSEESDEEEPSHDVPLTKRRKRTGFKKWAMKQLSTAKSYIAPPEADPPQLQGTEPLVPLVKKRRAGSPSKPGEMRGPLGEDLLLPTTSFAEHLKESAKQPDGVPNRSRQKVVNVKRPPEVEDARLLLPIVAEEQPIMEAILLNTVVIICGETGSGKTTQVPQFLYEAGFGSPDSDNPGMIGITQPRRVAAISMASRVAHELSLQSARVSYQIRYDATVSPSTSIKFMTDGVLLRELATDFLLTKYSIIIVDEAHERSMNTDILIGVLSRVIKLREEMWRDGKEEIKPLRLIIMSATLRVSDFAENTSLFPIPPPVINVSARQHPVTVHFSRRTVSDYVTEAVRKASKIHARLPPGGILIFLTGQNEIIGVCKKLEAQYGLKALAAKRKMRAAAQIRFGNFTSREDEESGQRNTLAPTQADVEAEDVDLGDSAQNQDDLAADVDGDPAEVDADEDALDSDDASSVDVELGIDTEESDAPMHIVPLYALLASDKQMQVFQPPPAGSRLVVVATNVAETSLTIPGIRYVVDCGRAKERRYDNANGIQAFQVNWISKASAAQRAGRAGRTGPGHCYRLYSSALFEHYFDQFSQPEILRVPIEGVVLQMKSMHIDVVVNFPFPTSPDRASLQKAETILMHLGALKSVTSAVVSASGNTFSNTTGGEITDVGKAMALFPLSPRFSRMLVSGRQHDCLPYVIAIVSALSVGDPFLREEVLGQDQDGTGSDDDELSHLSSEAVRAKEVRKLRRRAFFLSLQMHASLGDSSSDIFRILSVVGAYEFGGGGHNFCEEHFVRPKAMEEIHKLRAQLSNIVQANFPDLTVGFTADSRPPTNLQLKVLRQLLAAGFIDQVAVRKDLAEKSTASGEKYTTSKGVPYRALGISEDVFVHPSSVLANKSPPDYVVFLEVIRTSRIWIKGLTVVNPAWLANLGKSLCTYSKPIITKEGHSVVIPHFGPAGWELPPIKHV